VSARSGLFLGLAALGTVLFKRRRYVCSHETLDQCTRPTARGSGIYAGQNLKGAPTATQTRDLPLRRRPLLAWRAASLQLARHYGYARVAARDRDSPW
jgi:hypothetical protein